MATAEDTRTTKHLVRIIRSACDDVEGALVFTALAISVGDVLLQHDDPPKIYEGFGEMLQKYMLSGGMKS